MASAGVANNARPGHHSGPGAEERCAMSGIDLNAVIDMIAERIAQRVATRVGDRFGEHSDPSPDLVTMREFARRNSISETTVRAMIKDGRLDAVKIGAAVRIRADAQIGKSAPRAPVSAGTPQARAAGILRRIS
jgi:excisionase family DNA binding protein